MTTRRQPLPARAAGDAPSAAAGRDDRTEQVLARSREIREWGRRYVQAARELVAVTRRWPGASAGSLPIAQDPADRLVDAREQIECSRQARARLAVLAADLVQTEEAIARIHDQMAGRDSRRAAQYRRVADDARRAACRAREIQHNADTPGPWRTS
jgi:hypothetical protein